MALRAMMFAVPVRRMRAPAAGMADTHDVEVELPGMCVRTGTLDTGVTEFDLQLTVSESFAGAGPGEGPAPARIATDFTRVTDPLPENHCGTRAVMAIVHAPPTASGSPRSN